MTDVVHSNGAHTEAQLTGPIAHTSTRSNAATRTNYDHTRAYPATING